MIDTDQLELESRHGGIERHLAEVETPMPESDGIGPAKEENGYWSYKVGDTWINAFKVGDRGWSVWQHADDNSGVEPVQRIDSGLSAQEAQRVARKKAEEVSEK